MRFEGVLSAWNHDAGYGTIRPLGGGEEVFVALPAFPTDGDGPQLNPALREAAGVGSLRVRQAKRKRRLGLAAGAVVVLLLLVAGGAHWWPHATADGPVRAGR